MATMSFRLQYDPLSRPSKQILPNLLPRSLRSSHAASFDETSIAQPSLPNAKKAGLVDFLHIDDFDKANILGILDRALEVKALLKSGDRSYQPFQWKNYGNDICKAFHED